MFGMARLNRTAAKLMHKFNAHAATDVTGFGILGHAKNLAANQKAEVSFLIESLPIYENMAKVAKASPINFRLFDGYSAETSGKIIFYLSLFPSKNYTIIINFASLLSHHLLSRTCCEVKLMSLNTKIPCLQLLPLLHAIHHQAFDQNYTCMNISET